MADNFISFADLKARGVFTNRMTLKRAIDRHAFPPGRLLTPNMRRWTEAEVAAWLATRPTKAQPITTPGMRGATPKASASGQAE
jgi:hypothetical protein